MTAPDRIWAYCDPASDTYGGWDVAGPGVYNDRAEYIRHDASPEVVATMPGAQAMVAAAYEAAATEADRHYAKGDMGNPGHWIHALTPADAKAALDRLIAKAVAAAYEVTAKSIETHQLSLSKTSWASGNNSGVNACVRIIRDQAAAIQEGRA